MNKIMRQNSSCATSGKAEISPVLETIELKLYRAIKKW